MQTSNQYTAYRLHHTAFMVQVTGNTLHLCIKNSTIVVSIGGNISITSLYYHLIAISYPNIIINISINVIINIIMFNIIAYITISLCLLTSHVTMTYVNATNTGWLPPHNDTTKQHLTCPCKMAIWQYGQEGLNSSVPLTQAIYKN